jgi:hypothetical protein
VPFAGAYQNRGSDDAQDNEDWNDYLNKTNLEFHRWIIDEEW